MSDTGERLFSDTDDDDRVKVDKTARQPHDAQAFSENDNNPDVEMFSASEQASLRSWRVAKSLAKLRRQVDIAFPDRNKASDGTIGDTNHCPGTSDHCPNINDGGVGVVTAFDLTHDPSGGCDCENVVESIRSSRDNRIKYIIWNGRICNYRAIGGANPWAWRNYSGQNQHTTHAHFSVRGEKSRYDDESEWTISRASLTS